jgi:dTDP-4-amino-4,6-dideoxygalactose transaminase/lipopolysaccharide/colanic/teichoic acid biosynthesis glycosyltransferase
VRKGKVPEMRKEFLRFSPPLIGDEEIAEVVDALRSDWITTGPRTQRFEEKFAVAVGAPRCLGVSSCTAALHLALVSLGIGAGDAVLTTPMTFCSGIHVVEQVGARPVLVDVEPDTLNIDPAKLKQQIAQLHRLRRAPRLKAILPVHLHGHPCDMDALLGIAREDRLAVIEDAAHALPARYKGRLVGSPEASRGVSLLTCFSFYATKNITTAEGGMLAGSAEMIEEARVWSLHGLSRDAWKRYAAGGSWHYDVIHAGFKYNMTDLQAAIGLHQLARLPGFHSRRKEIAKRYSEAFCQLDCLQVPTERPGVDHAWHVYSLRLHLDRLRISRDEFIGALNARKIACSVHFIPVHLHRYYREKYGYRPGDFPVAYREYQRMISLPLHPGMSDQDAEDVIEAVTEIVQNNVSRRDPRRLLACEPPRRFGPPEDAPVAGPALRRAFDWACAAAGLIFLAPVFALIAIAIRLDDGGPVFYSQFRAGKGLGRFRLFKFRSMVSDASSGLPLTTHEDARVTRVGRLLRKFKLDELPQLWNVVKGEMQLVGVRPQVERYVAFYRREYQELLQGPPGITDLASLCFREEELLFHEGLIEAEYLQRILPQKLELSLQYHRSRTFFSDLEILFRTALGFGPPPSVREAGSSRPVISPLQKAISRN